MGRFLQALQELETKQRRHDSNILRVATIAAAGEAFVIGSETFTCVASGAVAFQFVPGADAAGSLANIVACINTYTTQPITALGITGGVLVTHDLPGQFGLACTETLAGANNAWAAAAMYGGTNPTDPQGEIRVSDMVARVPNAVEVAVGSLVQVFGFDVASVMIAVRVTSGGAAKAWDGGYEISGRKVTLNNAGSTDWAATDTVTILASA